MPKIVLFNGPPRSGKDTCTKMALEYLGRRAVHYRFAAPLKDAIHGLFGIGGIIIEHFDAVKDEPQESLFGLTPRNAYIWLSEDVVKPKFGKDFFAQVAVNAIKRITDERIVVISDCGFADEVDSLVKAFGLQNVALVFLKRNGTDFANDSRSYIDDVICKQFSIENNGTFSELHEKVREMLESFIDAK